jgi:hypothetical protein
LADGLVSEEDVPNWFGARTGQTVGAKSGTATMFGDPTDQERYAKAKAQGKSESQALRVGDPGVGTPSLGKVSSANSYGIAVPTHYLRQQFGNNPASWRTARAKVTVNNQTVTVPYVDVGPGSGPQSKGVVTDATYPLSQALGGFDKTKAKIEAMPNAGPDYNTSKEDWYAEQNAIANQLKVTGAQRPGAEPAPTPATPQLPSPAIPPVTPGAGPQLAQTSTTNQITGIPAFATGGVVTKPTVALVGEAGPEAIIPLGMQMTGAENTPQTGDVETSDPLSFLFTNPDLESPDQFSQQDKSTTPVTAPKPIEHPAGAGGMYQDQRPNLQSWYQEGRGEEDALSRIMRNNYQADKTNAPLSRPSAQPQSNDDTTPATYAPNPATTAPPGPAANKEFSLGAPYGDSYDRIVGNGTTWGLDYDSGKDDAEDPNPTTAFGFNSHDKDIEGASLPISVIKNSIGDYENDPNIMAAIRRGDYKLAVTNQDGLTKTVPLIDAGPAEWTGNAIDLTYKTAHDLNTGGKAKVGYQLLGPDGQVVPIKGYHQNAIRDTDWTKHINKNSNIEPIPNANPKPAEKEPIPNASAKPVETKPVQGGFTLTPGGDMTPEEHKLYEADPGSLSSEDKARQNALIQWWTSQG